jgi:hypothetical protein
MAILTTKDKTFYNPSTAKRILRRPDFRNLIIPKLSGAPISLNQVDYDELEILQSYRSYSPDAPDEVKYFIYKLAQKNPEDLVHHTFYKAIRMVRLTRVPRYLREITAASGPDMIFEQQRDVLAALREQGALFTNIIAKSPEIPMIFAYGVQGVGDSLEEAQRRADEGYAVLTFQLNGTYQQLEYKAITVKEGELLARYQLEWRELAMARGRPLPVGTTSGMIPLIEGNRTEVESTNNQLESFLRGMGDKSFMLSLITVPISPAEITLAWRNLTEKLSAVRSDQQGARSFTAGVALPLTFGNSLGASAGTTHGETATQGVSLAHGVSSSVSHGLTNSLTNTLSHSTTQGTSVSQFHSVSESATQGANQGQSTSTSQGQSTTLGQSSSLSHTSTLGNSSGTSISHSLTNSASSTQGVSSSTSQSSTQGTSVSHTSGYSRSATAGSFSSQGVSNSSTASQGVTSTQGSSQSLSGTASISQGQSFGINSSTGTGYTASQSASHADGLNSSILGVLGSNHSTTSSATTGTSTSNGSGVSLGQTGTATVGHSFGSGQSNSQASSYSIGQNIGQSSTSGTSASNTNSVSNSSALSQSASTTLGSSATQSQSATQGESQGTTTSATQGASQTNAVGNISGVSLSNSASQGTSSSSSSGTSSSVTNGVTNGISQSQSQSATNGQSQAIGSSTSTTNTAGTSTTNANTSSIANAYGISNTQTDSTTGAIGLIPSLGVSVSRQTYNESKRIIGDIMEAQMRRYIEGIKSGAFFYQMFLICPDRETLVGAEGLLKSAFWGPGNPRDQLPQPFHVIDKFPGGAPERERLLTHAAALSSYRLREEMVELIEPLHYSTYITPTEAAAFTHPPTAESLGILAVHDSMPVTAMPADRSNREIMMGKIINGERAIVSTWNYGVDLNELTHVLIAGQTGSGKTTTLMKFLSEIAQMKKTVNQLPTVENPVVVKKEVQASILGLDWMPNMRNLASIVDPDRFRFYSLARPELGLFRWNLLEIPAEGMSPLEWLGAQADNFTASFNLRDYGRSLISEFLTDLYSANRLQDFTLRPATLDTQGQEIRPAIILPAIDPATLPPGAIQTGVDGEPVANVFTYPPLSRLVSICDLAVLVAARVEEVADPNKARLYGTDMRDRIQSLWRRLQYFVPDGPYAQVLGGDTSLTQRTTLGVSDIVDPDRGLVTIVETEGLDYPHRRLLIGSILLAVYRYGLHHGKGTFNQNDQGPGTIIVLEEAHELFGEQGPDENGDAAATRTALYESIFRRARALGLHLIAVAQEPSKLPSAVTANISAVFIHTLREKQERDKAFSLLNWSNQIGQQAREYRYLGELPRGYSLVSLTAQKHYLQAAPVQIKVDEAPLAEVSDKDLLTKYNNFVTKVKNRNP